LPRAKKAPSSNSQAPEKLQAASSKRLALNRMTESCLEDLPDVSDPGRSGLRDLEVEFFLELGAWGLELF
jgi:hypothetical protein